MVKHDYLFGCSGIVFPKRGSSTYVKEKMLHEGEASPKNVIFE